MKSHQHRTDMNYIINHAFPMLDDEFDLEMDMSSRLRFIDMDSVLLHGNDVLYEDEKDIED